jgi:hypothetical protein
MKFEAEGERFAGTYVEKNGATRRVKFDPIFIDAKETGALLRATEAWINRSGRYTMHRRELITLQILAI